MADFGFDVTDRPDPADLDRLGQHLAAYNEATVGPSGRRPLAVFARDDSGAIIAGASGYTAWGWLYVQWLWVAEAERGNRLAARLLAAAEAEALARGCNNAHIDTFNPEALRVYQRAGYRVFGELPDFVAGRTRSFLCKQLG